LQSTTALDAAASSGAASSGAGITRRKHLEEISDEELLDGRENSG